METIKTLLQFGNKKLPKTTMIFNMGSASSCSSDSLGLCSVSDICYAKKAERIYPQVLPYRNRQRDYWLKSSAMTIAFELMEVYNKKRNKPTHLRLNESGDFYSQKCVIKAEKVAEKIYKTLGVKSYIYTARKDLDFSGCKFLVVNGSGFKKEGVNRMFSAVKDPSKFEGFICPADCNICNKCSVNDHENILVKEH